MAVDPAALARRKVTEVRNPAVLQGTVVGALLTSHCRPEIGRGYPLNLSISLSGGKETNKDSLSNGE